MNIKVNEDLCLNCGTCVEECIHNTELGESNHVDHSFLFCNQCLHCYAVCPNNAIEIEGDFRGEDISGSYANYDGILSLLKKRRSVRQFKEKPIEDDHLEKLLEVTRYIPSGGNNQKVSITLLQDQEKMNLLKEEVIRYYLRMNKISQNLFFRTLFKTFGPPKIREGLSDKNFMEKINDMNKKFKVRDMVFYNAPLVIIFHTDRILPTAKEDAVLAAYNIILSAETLGLGSCFLSLSQQAINSKKSCKKIVNINKNDTVQAVVVTGYPVRQYKRTVFRDSKQINVI